MLSAIMKKMIDYSKGNLHDIEHFVKVHSYASTIGRLERLDAETQLILEASAIVHDIACPVLRERTGRCEGRLQELDGMPLARELLAGTGLTPAQLDRAVWLVGHHHTINPVDGLDHRILLEADYLVNANESAYPKEAIIQAKSTLFRTGAGTALLESMYGV